MQKYLYIYCIVIFLFQRLSGQELKIQDDVYYGEISSVAITVSDKTADLNTNLQEQITVLVYTENSDKSGESTQLSEIGKNTGLFYGIIGFERAYSDTHATPPIADNGLIGVFAEGEYISGEKIYVQYGTKTDSALYKEPSSTITGVVKDHMGNPVSGAIIGLIGSRIIGYSRTDGSYGLHDVPEGSYTMKIMRNNYAPQYYQVSVPDASPIAYANGPYWDAVGSQVQLNGNGYDLEDESLVFKWDLDGDGSFDDASGQMPLYTIQKTGLDTVWLNVIDDSGNEDIDMAIVYGESDNINHKPNLTPAGPFIKSEGQLLSFPVNASDPDGGTVDLTMNPDNLPPEATFTDHGNN
ncbi:carboxypeptidase regulatory-like domain-containing protein, partial [bacterium]|nr:carboxypeptidase regulatory-like domain-containing protein [bacterium]